jgi:glycosyltransferase involved in cell wall biosynthesis
MHRLGVDRVSRSVPALIRYLRRERPDVLITRQVHANMTYWKRLDLLVDAFAEVRRQRPARLLIVGEGPGRADAEDRIRRLGLEADVEAVGWADDPLQYAARAWAFVLPSDEEGFAQVLTEAMSVDCPVITTDARGGGRAS